MIHQALKLLPPEMAHSVGKWAMKFRLGAAFRWKGKSPTYDAYFFGTPLISRFGLAAGFDKNGELVDVVQDYGFGFIEVGSVTHNGGEGNEKPRLFRIEDGDLLNRMGLNGDPAEIVAKRLSRAKSTKYGVNIAKTHDPAIMGDKAIVDIVMSYRYLQSFGLYTCINISCPNTKEGKTFETPGALQELLVELRRQRTINAQPLFVKLSPTLALEKDHLQKVVAICEEFGVKGFVCSNTLPFNHPRYGKGGASGSRVKEFAFQLCTDIRFMSPLTKIIGCGGITTGADAFRFHRAGADYFQSYAGFIQRGPGFAFHIKSELDAVMKKEIQKDEIPYTI